MTYPVVDTVFVPGTTITHEWLNGVNDYVNESNPSDHSAANVTYDPPFTGAVATNVEDKLAQTVSVKDFGAVGDGVTDDTAAIQDALTSGAINIYVPTGTYLVSGILTVPVDGVMYGESVNGTIITTSGAGTSFNIVKLSNGATLQNLTVNGNGLSNSSAVLIDTVSRAKCINVRACYAGFHGIALTNASYCQVVNCETDNNSHRGVIIDPHSYGNIVTTLYSHDNELAALLVGHDSHDNVISDFVFEGTTNAQLWCHNASYNNVFKNGIIRLPADATSPAIFVALNAYRNTFSDIIISGNDRSVVLRAGPPDSGYATGDTRQNIFSSLTIIGTGTSVVNSVAFNFDSIDSGTTKVSNNKFDNVIITECENGFRCVNDGTTDTYRNFISDCDASVNVTFPWRFGTTTPGLGENVIRNLKGYTPYGVLTSAGQPAVPATGVAVTNPYPYPCIVYVAGLPALSGVEINGTNVNPAPTTTDMNIPFYLDVRQTIKLNYSSGTPSWRWWGIA